MNTLARLVCLLPIVALAACSSTGSAGTNTGALVTVNSVPPVTALPTTAPAQTTATALASTDAINFIDSAAVPLLSARDRTEASSAQFYALQFGRPGAPRAWTGDAGTKGSVSVGPYVRVNNLDCRDFTHEVTIAGTSYTRKGTACREVNGTWSVVSGASVG